MENNVKNGNDWAVKWQVREEETVSTLTDSQRQLPSALTVENLRKHEEESDSIDVVELMAKNRRKDDYEDAETDETTLKNQKKVTDVAEPITSLSGGKGKEKKQSLKCRIPDEPFSHSKENVLEANSKGMQLVGDIWSQSKQHVVEPIVSPAVREEVRGFRFSGEEFVAVSVDVQTDESYLNEASQFLWPKNNLDHKIGVLQSKKENSTGPAYEAKPSATNERRTKVNRDECKVAEQDVVKDITEWGLEASGGTSSKSIHEAAQTLAHVGHPFILQYKPESKTVWQKFTDVNLSMLGNSKLCEVSPEEKDYYGVIMESMKQNREEKTAMFMQEKQLIDIERHSAYGSQKEKKLAKDREGEKSMLREMKKQPKQVSGAGGQTIGNQTNFYAFARQLKTVNYSLSSEKCMEEGWTIRPVSPPRPKNPASEIFIHDTELEVVSSGKTYVQLNGLRNQHTFVKKLYSNGSVFLIIFPDGTGNVWYPSGNVAFSIVASEKLGKLSFIVQQDIHSSEGENIQAIFGPTGYGTCYYPSGVVRLFLTPLGGEYYSPQGERLKKWLWKDTNTHVHAPPFQPITFALSKRVGVRVISQESIFISFSHGNRSVRFNAGTRLRLKASTFLPQIYPSDVDEVILNEKRFHVLTIMEKIKNSLKFSNSPRLENIHLPNYLTAQFDKNAKLREHLKNQRNHEIKPVKKSTVRNDASANATSTGKLPVIKVRSKNKLVTIMRKSCQDDAGLHPVVTVN